MARYAMEGVYAYYISLHVQANSQRDLMKLLYVQYIIFFKFKITQNLNCVVCFCISLEFMIASGKMVLNNMEPYQIYYMCVFLWV